MANYETIRLEKGLYTTGKSFTAALEELDPSENYKGTSLEGLDAYQRQLKRFGIKVSGKGSDTVEKFFKTTDSAALFPEYVSRAVYQGISENDILSNIVSSVTQINSLDYRTIASIPADSTLELRNVDEGSVIPETSIRISENLVKLHKRGRMLVASYESLRFQRLDLFTVMLRQIGAYIAKTQLADAIAVMLNGDGNENPIETMYTQQQGQITYGDLVDFWNTFDPYTMNTVIASPNMVSKLLKLSTFQDSAAGLDFHASGKLVTPFGAQLLKSSALDENTLIGLDKNYAIEQIQAGGVMTEFDKLIDRQLERAAITSICGFSKVFSAASKALSIEEPQQ